jgi:aspartyl-tRNA synthetase
LNVFEGLTRHLLKEIKGVEVDKFPRMTYEHAIIHTEMTNPTSVSVEFGELNAVAKTRSSLYSIPLN